MTSPEQEPKQPPPAADGHSRASAGDGRPDCRVEWSPQFQYCTGAAHDATGKLIVALTCGRPEPCLDPIVRQRIEMATHASLQLLLAALRA